MQQIVPGWINIDCPDWRLQEHTTLSDKLKAIAEIVDCLYEVEAVDEAEAIDSMLEEVIEDICNIVLEVQSESKDDSADIDEDDYNSLPI